MTRFLSAAWIAELDRLAAASDSLGRATRDVSLVIQQEVTGGPEGDVTYHVVLDQGSVAIRSGSIDEPDVSFRQDHGTAVAIGQGELSAQAAFLIGKLTVRGEVGLLLRHQDAFDGVEDVFAAVRATTDY